MNPEVTGSSANRREGPCAHVDAGGRSILLDEALGKPCRVVWFTWVGSARRGMR
jgi:hypothetical protein